MSNTTTVMKNAGIIAKASAMALVDNLKFVKTLDKADESDWQGKNSFSAGDTLQINKPARFVPNTSFDATSQLLDFVEETVPLTLDTISSVPVTLATDELAHDINIKQIVKRIIKPAVSNIAMDIENRMLLKALNATYHEAGTAGSTSFDTNAILTAQTKINKSLAPQDDERYLLVESLSSQAAVNARKGLFQSSEEISKQYKKGLIGIADGFTWMRNELLPSHTNGTATVAGLTVTTTVSTQGATTLLVTDSGGASETLTAGTKFTVAGVYAVHPATKQKYPYLQEFVVTADATATSGAFTLTVSPAMHTTGSLQNISAFPQSSGTVTPLSGAASTAYQLNLAYHKNAFRFASVPLVMPTAVEFAAQETYEGVTVAIVRAFDVYKRTMVTRMDVLCGLAAVRPEWASSITA
jgi:hypothetical protein